MMKKQNKKLAVALLAVGCASLCVGGFAVSEWVAPNAIVASAEAVRYEVNTLTVTNGNASLIEAYPNDGSDKPAGDTTWNYLYTPQNGGSITLNGEALTEGYKIKQPNDFYIELSVVINAGDVIVLNGEFYNATSDYTFVFNNCALKFNGATWEVFTAPATGNYTQYNLGKLGVHVNSRAGQAVGNVNTGVYLERADAGEIPGLGWEPKVLFTLESGTGVKINGEAVDFKLQSPDGGNLYLDGFTLQAGGKLTIGGSFVAPAQGLKYTIEDTVITWTGTGWEVVDEVVTPDEEVQNYTVSELTPVWPSTTATGNPIAAPQAIYLGAVLADASLPLPKLGWNNYTPFTLESGEGVKINDVAVTGANFKLPGEQSRDMYLDGWSADQITAGTKVTISGVFATTINNVKHVVDIATSTFIWNGSFWYKEVTYTDYDLGKLAVHINSVPGGVDPVKDQGVYLKREGDGEIPKCGWQTLFISESGAGVTLNDEAVDYTMESPDGNDLYFKFVNGVEVGDVITISGTFICNEKAMRYSIEESKFVLTERGWEKYIEYETHELGKAVGISVDGFAVWLSFAEGVSLPLNEWEVPFSRFSGNGITLNDEEIDMANSVKSVENKLYVDLHATQHTEGTILKIGGVLYNVDWAVKYSITDTTFVWDGSAWLTEFDVLKNEAKAALDEYKATFAEADYYPAEWQSMATFVEAGKANIDAATTAEEVSAALEGAKATLDNVVTKAESDEVIDGLKVSAKEELATYKSASEYREAEVAAMQTILANANTAIDAATSVTDINAIVENAKKDLDALKTAATHAEEEKVVADAKAELANFKSETDYKATEWAAIQTIINQAYADIEAAIGDAEAISGIVATAKTEIDKVKTAAQVDAEALETAKKNAKDEVQSYYNALNYDLYSDDAMATLSTYIKDAKDAIDDATTVDAINAIVTQFKANVDGVEQIKAAKASGCGAVLGGGLTASVALAAAASLVFFRKKKED